MASLKEIRRPRLQGLVLNRPLTGPQTVHFDIANACNTRCVTCWHHSPHLHSPPDGPWKNRRMSLEAFRSLLDGVLAAGGLEQVIISAMGEPFVNDDIYAMIRHAQGLGLGVTVISNILAAQVPRLLEPPGPPVVLASLCGASEAVWRAFHGYPEAGGFGRVVERLEALASAGTAVKHVHVIAAPNVHELEDMVRLAKRLGAQAVSFKLASLGQGTEAVALSPEQRDHLITRLIPRARLLAGALGVKTDLEAFAGQIHPSPRTAPMEDVGCFMGFVYCRITVEGELLFCCNTHLSAGVICEDRPFGELWRGEPFTMFRDRLRRGQFFPGCDQCGKYKQNLAWSRRLRQELAPEVVANMVKAP